MISNILCCYGIRVRGNRTYLAQRILQNQEFPNLYISYEINTMERRNSVEELFSILLS